MKEKIDARTIRFRQILHWLKVEKGVMRQEDLAAAIGVNINTISRANSGKRMATDDMLLSIKEKFNMPQTLEWLRADDIQPRPFKHPDIIQTEKNGETSIIELYATLIKEVEGIRRDLTSELEDMRTIKAELADEREDIKKQHEMLRSITEQLTQCLLHTSTIYPTQEYSQLPMVAESTD